MQRSYLVAIQIDQKGKSRKNRDTWKCPPCPLLVLVTQNVEVQRLVLSTTRTRNTSTATQRLFRMVTHHRIKLRYGRADGMPQTLKSSYHRDGMYMYVILSVGRWAAVDTAALAWRALGFKLKVYGIYLCRYMPGNGKDLRHLMISQWFTDVFGI